MSVCENLFLRTERGNQRDVRHEKSSSTHKSPLPLLAHRRILTGYNSSKPVVASETFLGRGNQNCTPSQHGRLQHSSSMTRPQWNTITWYSPTVQKVVQHPQRPEPRLRWVLSPSISVAVYKDMQRKPPRLVRILLDALDVAESLLVECCLAGIRCNSDRLHHLLNLLLHLVGKRVDSKVECLGVGGSRRRPEKLFDWCGRREEMAQINLT